jgi:CxxC motif-containing protein (DUF1111 family)
MNRIKLSVFISTIAFATLFAINSCSKIEPPMPNASKALCGPIGLSNQQTALFVLGNNNFFQNRTASSGLGPYFVSTSCGNCHSQDNRGHPFTILTRFGQSDTNGNTYLTKGGPQLQDKALPGFTAQQIPPGASSSKFIAPITAGVGFLEAVPDSQILGFAAANANNPDGVRGHPNYNTIPSYVTPFMGDMPRGDGKYICRFGRKGSTYNIVEQVAQAYNHDMGITSVYLPNNPYNYLDQMTSPLPGNPEVDNNSFNSVVFYVQVLATPPTRNSSDPTVIQGSQIFANLGCATCHQPHMTTGYSPIDGLSYQPISPYTDLLVHDMGPGLDDGYTEGTAKTSEWRTAPLWGLGSAPVGQGGQFFLLHDGRAHSILQAIQMHGGEAATSVGRFNQLSTTDVAALLSFLNSL